MLSTGSQCSGRDAVGVKAVSRLISRIRNRQSGILVTTSVIMREAYEEDREDCHPSIFLSGKDIAEIVTVIRFNNAESVKRLLDREFETAEREG